MECLQVWVFQKSGCFIFQNASWFLMLCKYSSKYTRNLGKVRAMSLPPYTIHFELVWSLKMALGYHSRIRWCTLYNTFWIGLEPQIWLWGTICAQDDALAKSPTLFFIFFDWSNRIFIPCKFYLNNFSPFAIPVFMFISETLRNNKWRNHLGCEKCYWRLQSPISGDGWSRCRKEQLIIRKTKIMYLSEMNSHLYWLLDPWLALWDRQEAGRQAFRNPWSSALPLGSTSQPSLLSLSLSLSPFFPRSCTAYNWFSPTVGSRFSLLVQRSMGFDSRRNLTATCF